MKSPSFLPGTFVPYISKVILAECKERQAVNRRMLHTHKSTISKDHFKHLWAALRDYETSRGAQEWQLPVEYNVFIKPSYLFKANEFFGDLTGEEHMDFLVEAPDARCKNFISFPLASAVFGLITSTL